MGKAFELRWHFMRKSPENLRKNIRNSLGEPCGNYWKSTISQGNHRETIGKLQVPHRENIGKPLENLNNQRKTIRKPSVNQRETIGNLRKTIGETTGKP